MKVERMREQGTNTKQGETDGETNGKQMGDKWGKSENKGTNGDLLTRKPMALASTTIS